MASLVLHMISWHDMWVGCQLCACAHCSDDACILAVGCACVPSSVACVRADVRRVIARTLTTIRGPSHNSARGSARTGDRAVNRVLTAAAVPSCHRCCHKLHDYLLARPHAWQRQNGPAVRHVRLLVVRHRACTHARAQAGCKPTSNVRVAAASLCSEHCSAPRSCSCFAVPEHACCTGALMCACMPAVLPVMLRACQCRVAAAQRRPTAPASAMRAPAGWGG